MGTRCRDRQRDGGLYFSEPALDVRKWRQFSVNFFGLSELTALFSQTGVGCCENGPVVIVRQIAKETPNPSKRLP
jgi:hypothetical protein